MIAHVLSGSVLPAGVEWIAAVLLFGGAFAALATRRRRWRRVAAAAAGVGLVVTATGFVADATLPGPAPYGLRIVAPQTRTPHGAVFTAQDAVFTVCGVRGDGTLLVPTDSQHWLAPFVDGEQRPGITAFVYPVRLLAGAHVVRFDLVSPEMREFTPAVTVSEHIVVDPAAPVDAPRRC